MAALPILGAASAVLADETPRADWSRGATLSGSPDGDAVPAPAQPRPTRMDMEALQEVNRLRAQHGLGPISYEERLFAAAYAHSLEQIAGNFLGHDSRVSGRGTLAQRMNAEGYYGRMYAEVVARDYVDARAVVQAWMDSPRHREVLLDPDLSQGAFARVEGSIPGLNRWTGDFSAPAARQTPTPAPTPKPAATPSAPSGAARVSLPATSSPRSNPATMQPPIPQPTARAAATSPGATMPAVPSAAPRALPSSSGSVPIASSGSRAGAVPPPPPPAPAATQPRVMSPLPQVPRLAATPAPTRVPPPAPGRVVTPAAPSRAPFVASAPVSPPYRPAPAPKRQPRRVGDCAT